MVEDVVPVRKDLIEQNVHYLLEKFFAPDEKGEVQYLTNLFRVLEEAHGLKVSDFAREIIEGKLEGFMQNRAGRLGFVSFKELKEEEGWLLKLLSKTEFLEGFVTEEREMDIVWDSKARSSNRPLGLLISHEMTHVWQSDNILLMSYNLYESLTEYLGWLGNYGSIPSDGALLEDEVKASTWIFPRMGYNKDLAYKLFSQGPECANAIMDALAGDFFSLETVGYHLERMGEEKEAINIYDNMVAHIEEKTREWKGRSEKENILEQYRMVKTRLGERMQVLTGHKFKARAGRALVMK